MSPLEILKRPDLINSMAVSQKFILGLKIAVLGMSIVFFILVLLMVTLKIMEKFLYEGKSDKSTKEKVTEKNAGDDKSTASSELKRRKKVAAIAAAIMKGYYQPNSKLKINKITKIDNNISLWGKVSRAGGNLISGKLKEDDNYEKI